MPGTVLHPFVCGDRDSVKSIKGNGLYVHFIYQGKLHLPLSTTLNHVTCDAEYRALLDNSGMDKAESPETSIR